MEKKSTLESNLKKYTALAGGLTAVAGGLNAQVVYTDVNPDETVSSSGTTQYLIDFNSDAALDAAFVAGTVSGVTGTYAGYSYVLSQDVVQMAFGSGAPATNGWMGSSSNANAPMALSAGSAIGSTGSFFGAQANVAGTMYVSWPNSTSYNTSVNLGNFTAGSEAYVGVRFDISGSAHYGWIRVEVGSDEKSLIIKDYAYESTAGTAITAGDMGGTTGIEELADQVMINNVFNKLNVRLDGIDNANLTVLGLDGKQHINQTIGSTAVVDMSTLTTGIYLVNVSTEEGTTTKKIYVK